MYRLRLMCMDDGLHKEGDIIDGMDMMEAYLYGKNEGKKFKLKEADRHTITGC